MAKLAIKKASTDVTTYVFIQDSSKTTGEGLTGLAYNTASLVGYYVRPKGSATAITLATQTVTGDHSDGGFVEVDATNMPGVYRLDLPDAVCATGVPSVVVMLKGAANMSPVVLEIQLTDFDLNTAGVTLASSQPAITWGQQKIIADVGSEGALDIRNSHSNGFGLFNSGYVAQYNDGGYVGVANDGGSAAVVGFDPAIATATKLQTVDDIVDTIKTKTDNLPATPASAGEYTAAIAAIPTAPLLAANYTAPDNASIATIKAKTNLIPANPAVADEYDAALAAIQADLDNPNQYKADVSGIPAAVWGYATRTLSSFGSLIADIWSHVTRTLSSFGFTVATNSDANVTAIKAKTDNLPATPASAGEYAEAIAAIPTAPLLAANYVAPDNATIGEIKAKTDNIPATPLTAQQVWEYVTRELTSQGSGGATAQEVWEYATRVLTAGTNIDLTPLAKTTHLQEVEDKVDGIKGITDQLTFTVPNKVDASATVDPTGIATSAELEIVGGKVDGVLNKLNVSSVEFVTAVVGSTITILRGDTLSAQLLDLGDITQYASLDFTIKRVAGELDDAAKIRLRKNASGADDGLLRLNGAEHTSPTDGSIVIDDLTTGDIEIRLNANATSELVPGNYVYDIQLITANEVKTLTSGKCKVTADVTRATV